MSNYPQGIHVAGQSAKPTDARTKYPVVYWAAAIGAALLAFELYLLINWVTGPNFVTVPYGPSELPGWMKMGIDIAQPLWVVALLYGAWRMLVRPWLRERRVTTWGLMVPVLMLTAVYDPTSCYFHNWFGYNAYFLNYGSPLPGGLPGWQGFAEPGAMIAWPILFLPCVYPFLFIFTAWGCAKLMGAMRSRFPHVHGAALMALCFLFALFLDVVLEGNFMMRLGWYAETGLSINAGEYYQLPWRNAIGAAFVFSAMGSLFFFRNDRGQIFVERGLERFTRNSSKEIVLRFLALLTAIQLIMMFGYHVPVAFHEKYFQGHWPESIASKTYFNGHMCGFDTPRPCP